MTVCILVLVLSVLRTAVLCLWKEQADNQCGTVSVLCCVTVCILELELSVLRTAVLCLWKEKTDNAVWHSY